MKSVDLDIAYQLQKKYHAGRNITAYKVGASNLRSANFFNSNEFLLGGIEESCIFHHVVTKDYPIAEVELVCKLQIDTTGCEICEWYLGVECPEVVVENPRGSAFICVADNCAAGDLIIFERVSPEMNHEIKVFINNDLRVIGHIDALVQPARAIVDVTLELIEKYGLPVQNLSWIATGGLTETFDLKKGDRLRFEYA